MKTFNSWKHATQNYELQPVLLFFFFFPSVFYYYNFILLQVKHTQKKKQQNLHRINKEIKRKKQKQKTNK